MSAVVYDHKPTEQETKIVSESLGGMHCISTHVFEVEVNGNPTPPVAITD